MAVGPGWLDRKISSGSVVTIDGGTGTGLESRGVPMVNEGWSVMAQLEYPDILRQLHADYIEAGAEVIITNTFGAGRHLLEPGGLGDRVEDAHTLAVAIARQARDEADHPVAVAGSISGYMANSADDAWLARLSDTYEEQVELLVEAGVDLIALEMVEHPRLAVPAVRAAAATNLPVWLGISSRTTPDGLMTSFEPETVTMRETLEATIAEGVDAVMVMHTPVPDVQPTLELVADLWDGPTGVYPESGYFIEPHWQFVDIIEPDDLVDAARVWVDQGAQLIGGCCGLDSQHISALHTRLPASLS
jgi:S-methylmethionine-dependent homocysteine/selenocysteine methylase